MTFTSRYRDAWSHEHQQAPCRKEAHTMTLPLLGVDGASL